MTTTELEIVLDESLFDGEPECQHSAHGRREGHSGPAKYLIRHKGCGRCGHRPRDSFLICGPGWESAGQRGVFCTACKYIAPRDKFWEVIETL